MTRKAADSDQQSDLSRDTSEMCQQTMVCIYHVLFFVSHISVKKISASYRTVIGKLFFPPLLFSDSFLEG